MRQLEGYGYSSCFRMWINQPSESQPMHNMHGQNVLGHAEPYDHNFWRVYPVSGDTISMLVPYSTLSRGWT